ncbi:hypothetical protein GRF29_8g1614207 [Pseudopithomyces chartarum]|uniref:Uncharacterized protein n=1 Tax=Pseudopithomyces chartarum TaxID=1892770 RepID=A0AAN6M408_9PLEO|nr:hypothetical protein GRF29_8g1614207 [Pseudopithomyces chartarum]
MSDPQASDRIAATTKDTPAPNSGNKPARVPLGELKLFTPGSSFSQSPSTPPSTWYSDDGVLAPPGSPTSFTAYDAVHQAHRKLAAVLFGSEDMDCMTWSLDNRPS